VGGGGGGQNCQTPPWGGENVKQEVEKGKIQISAGQKLSSSALTLNQKKGELFYGGYSRDKKDPKGVGVRGGTYIHAPRV